MSATSIEALRNLVTDLQFVDGMRGTHFALLGAHAAGERADSRAALPRDAAGGAAYDELIEKVKSNEIMRGKLLSDDGPLALIVLALEPRSPASSK